MEFGSYKGTGPRIRVRRRAELGRRLTRRLSFVAKMPAAILSRANQPEPRPVEITAIAPDKTQLTLSASSPGAISSVVAPVLLKYRVCRPRLLLAGSRAEVDPAADVALLHGEVLLIEDFARQYDAIGDTDRRYRATEKLLHAEEEYHEALCSAKELYAHPLARSYPEFHDVIFQPFTDLSRVSAEHCQRESPGKLRINSNPATKILHFQQSTELDVADGSYKNQQEIILHDKDRFDYLPVRTRQLY